MKNSGITGIHLKVLFLNWSVSKWDVNYSANGIIYMRESTSEFIEKNVKKYYNIFNILSLDVKVSGPSSSL